MDALPDAAGPLGLLILALVDSTSMGTLVIPVFLLIAARGGARAAAGRTVLYLAVIGVFYLVLGALLLAGLLPLLGALMDWLSSGPGTVLAALAGAGLVWWSHRSDPAVIRTRGGDPEASSRRWIARVRDTAGRPRAVVGLALLAGVIEAASMLPYLAAMGIIADLGIGWARGVGVLLAYCAVMILPALLLSGLRVVLGRSADRALERLQDWLARSAASGLSWTTGIVGVLLLVHTLGPALGALTGA